MKRLLFSMATAAVLLTGGVSAMAQSSGRWNPYLELEGRGGDREERSQSRTFIPFFQDDCSMLFGDIRMMYIEGGAWEGNFGLGHRRILSSQRVLGIYGFYDVRNTTNDNTFHQGSVGAELLDINWGIRSNVYLPDTSPQNARGGNAFLQGNNILVQGNQERAYYGVDVEAEHILWRDDCTSDIEIWAAGGYFNFDNSATNFRHISGPRARVEARLYDLPVLGNDSRIVASGQYEYDDVRGSVSQGFLSVRIPLGCGANCRPKMSLLDRRMVTPIMRDVDIVTNVAQGGDIFLGVNAKTGTILDDVVTLTAEDDIYDEIQDGPDGRTFILDGVDGALVFGGGLGDGIDLQDEQILIGGGGSMQVVGLESGLEATFTADGDPFTMVRDNQWGPILELAENNGIYGLTLDGGYNSIQGVGSLLNPFDAGNPGYFEIAGNTFVNAKEKFIVFDANDGTHHGCILDNNFYGLGETDTAVRFTSTGDADLAVTISGNHFDALDDYGVRGSAYKNSSLQVDIQDNEFHGYGETDNGVRIFTGNNSDSNLVIDNNLFDDINEKAIELKSDNVLFFFGSNATHNLMITNNTILGRGNTETGIEIFASDDSVIITGLIENNIFDDVTDDGIDIGANDDAMINMAIINNQFIGRGNTDDGIDVELEDDSTLNLFVSHNIFDNVNSDAIEVDADDDSILNLDFYGNEIFGRGNTRTGVDIDLDDDAEADVIVEHNLFDDILDDGILADVSDDTLLNMDIYNNQFIGRGNTEDGIDIEMRDDSTVNLIVGHNIFDNIRDLEGEGNNRAFEVDADDDSALDLEFYGNKIFGRGNTTDGVDIEMDDESSLVAIFEGNLFKNLTDDAIHIHGNDDADLVLDIFDNKFRNVAERNIVVHAEDYSYLDAIINNNNIKGGVEGIEVFAGYEGDHFLTIGGNKMRKITGIGIAVDADDTLILDDAGMNNKVKVDGGVVSDIDDGGDVEGTIRINGTDITVPAP